MSSLSLSGSESLLRMAVAVPVSVATLPIGSLAGACGDAVGVEEGAGEADGGAVGRAGCGAGEAGGVGDGGGWLCASLVGVETAPAAGDENPSSMAKGGA